MKRNWSTQELEQEWSLSIADREKLEGRKPAQQLGLAVLIGFYRITGRFPEGHRDVPKLAVMHVAEQIGVHPSIFSDYAFGGRTAGIDQTAVRRHLGWRVASDKDGETLLEWLRVEILGNETNLEQLTDLALGWFRERHLEALSDRSLDRLLRGALRKYENEIFEKVTDRLSNQNRQSLDQLLETGDADGGDDLGPMDAGKLNLNDLRSDPARPGLESVFQEVAKLRRIDQIELSANLFDGVSGKLITTWRRRIGETEWRRRISGRCRRCCTTTSIPMGGSNWIWRAALPSMTERITELFTDTNHPDLLETANERVASANVVKRSYPVTGPYWRFETVRSGGTLQRIGRSFLPLKAATPRPCRRVHSRRLAK